MEALFLMTHHATFLAVDYYLQPRLLVVNEIGVHATIHYLKTWNMPLFDATKNVRWRRFKASCMPLSKTWQIYPLIMGPLLINTTRIEPTTTIFIPIS